MHTIPDVPPVVWRDWCFDPPYGKVGYDQKIELRNQHHWGLRTLVTSIGEMPPWMNVACVEWREIPLYERLSSAP